MSWSEPSIDEPVTMPEHQLCTQCGAAVEPTQRYCVHCAARQPEAPNPATAYFAAAAAVRRTRPPAPTGSNRLAIVGLFFVVLPLVLALGVVLGRGERSNSNDSALLAALRQQHTITEQATPTTVATTTPLSSTGTLGKGFVIELQTLPLSATTQAQATAAESADTTQGAPSVGLINPSDYTLTPSSGSYVIYSGFYTSQSAATAALAKIKAKFPIATVVAIAPVGSSAPPVSTGTTAPVVSTSKPTAQQVQQDQQVVNQLSKQTGHNYVQSQQSLPNVIVVK